MRHRLQRRAAAHAGWTALTAITTVALAAPLVAFAASADRGRSLAIAAAVVTLGLGIAGLYLGRLAPRRRWKDDGSVARFVGRSERAVGSDLLSAVELGDDPPDGVSSDLIDELVRRTALATNDLDGDTLVPVRRARRARLAFLSAVAIYGGVYLVAPSAVAGGWDRLLSRPDPGLFGGAALSDRPLVGDITIRLEYPPHTRRAPVELPSGSGDVRVMPGTLIELGTTALAPVDSARIMFGEPGVAEAAAAAAESKPGDPPPPVDMAVEGNRLVARFSVTEPTEYRFLLSRGGARRTERTGHQIEVEPDAAPTVELYAPADELDVTSLKRIELAYLAEDDYGIAKAELVFEGKRTVRKVLPLANPGGRSAQAKYLLDLAEISLEPGVRVAYHVEVTDNDAVLGPNVGKSRTFYLRVFSARERHEGLIDRQAELLENMIRLLGGRLIVPAEDIAAHRPLVRDTAAVVVELGGLVAALGEDQLAARELITALTAMRARLDSANQAEDKLLGFLDKKQAGGTAARFITAKLDSSDKALAVELEDDVLLLADWIDRQRLEILLAITDEIENHQKRLDELFKEYARTGSEEIKKEIERELRELEKKLAELARKQGTLSADVLDQFLNRDAMEAQQQMKSCTEEVRELLAAGKAAEAQARMAECASELDQAAQALEDSLSSLRGEKFSAEEKKLGELMNDLADLARDQDDIAQATDEVWERYAEKADDLMRDTAKDTRRKLARSIEKLQQKLDSIPADGLTPFASEELAIVDNRVKDLKEMLSDGDMAEALAMARQAASSLETMDAELESALEDDPRGPFARRTRDARKALRKAQPLADDIVRELEEATPSPDQIMESEDRRALEKLRRRQNAVRERARKLGKRTEAAAGELPGRVGSEVSKRLEDAAEPMQRAGQGMRRRDPSAARQAAREAADKLEAARKSAQGAARQRQEGGGGLRDEPVRIPGAEDYKAPQKFREDILEAMKKEAAPAGFDELVRRYYEELIR